MKRLIVMFILPAFFALAGCEALQLSLDQKAAPSQELFTAVAWNVQNLFDPHEAGTEYPEFRESAGWNQEKYQARLTAISQAISQMLNTGSPDLIGLVEVENVGVLDDLAGGSLAKNGYCWTAFASIPGSALGIGFLSRYPLTETRAHSITVGNETAPRPILEVRLEPRGTPLVFLLCHWKSKLGGEDETEALRRSSARVVQRRLQELKKSEPDTPVIVMGDLNVNHDEFYRRSTFSALLPDDPDAAALAANAPMEYLVISAEMPPQALHFPGEVQALYSPWEGMSGGSYYYRNSWETIDHFLLSDALFNGSPWEFEDFRALDQAPFTSSRGTPDSYVLRLGRGLSDHLPLLLYLRYSGGD